VIKVRDAGVVDNKAAHLPWTENLRSAAFARSSSALAYGTRTANPRRSRKRMHA